MICTQYKEVNLELSAKLLSLADDFPFFRKVAGDGNCFYRAFIFAMLEALVTRPNERLVHK